VDIILICATAFAAGGITLFSGFGLATLLMPVMAIFFPVEIAIALTAVVHLLSTLFRAGILWRDVNKHIVLAFGFPAFLAVIPGALLLTSLSRLEPIASYRLAGQEYKIFLVKLVVGLLLIVFATADLFPFFKRFSNYRWGLSIGGILSGFFGGLSGHQGAFRSAFLIQAGLPKKAFVSTNAAIAALIDSVRLIIYGISFDIKWIQTQFVLLLLTTGAAFSGVLLGTYFMKDISFTFIRKGIAIMLYTLGGLLCIGLI